MKPQYYWIKERDNPQLGTYYVACGKITVKEARRMENSLYGFNIMHKFSSKAEYEAHLAELKAAGKDVKER